jgi:hypothetical protein
MGVARILRIYRIETFVEDELVFQAYAPEVY